MRIIPPYPGPALVFMENPPAGEYQKKENLSYLMIGKHLFQKGIPVPEIYTADLSHGWFILEDMGEINLQEEVSRHDDPLMFYEKVLDILFQLQFEGVRDFNAKWCCQTGEYDISLMRRFESDYFRDSFLSNFLGGKKDWPELEKPFNHLASIASRADNHYFLHRDFQSRNIMISEGKIGILDWQGGRFGPPAYDLASLIIDPYTNLSAGHRKGIYRKYLSLLKAYQTSLVGPFEKYFPYLAIQRNLQILGAFSYLTKVRGKTYFRVYMLPALQSLYRLLDELGDPWLSSLAELVDSLLNNKETISKLGGFYPS